LLSTLDEFLEEGESRTIHFFLHVFSLSHFLENYSTLQPTSLLSAAERRLTHKLEITPTTLAIENLMELNHQASDDLYRLHN
jgi:hypothetical protein